MTSAENSSGTTSMSSRRMKICPRGWVRFVTTQVSHSASPADRVGGEPGHGADDDAHEHLLVCLHPGRSLAANGSGAYLPFSGSCRSTVEPLVQLTESALPERPVPPPAAARGGAGLRAPAHTYQTTFWYDFGEPANVVEEAILALRPRVVGRRRIAGVEWWLSRMSTTDVRVDFHQDRDEKLALRTGQAGAPAPVLRALPQPRAAAARSPSPGSPRIRTTPRWRPGGWTT